MDNELLSSVESKRSGFRRQIDHAIANPTRDVEQMIAWVRNKGEPEIQHEVTLRKFTLDEARVFLFETKSALEQAIDEGRYVGANIVAELRPEKAKENTQKVLDQLKAAGIKFDEDSAFDHPLESFDEHELAHIEKAHELGVQLKDAELSLYFVDGGWGLKPVLSFRYPDTDPVTDIRISLAPKKLSDSDAIRVAQQLGLNKNLINEKPATVAGLIKEFNEKTRGMGFDLMKYLRTGELEA